MKRITVLLALALIVLVGLAACNTPAPLPVAPTPIPALAPATMTAPNTQASAFAGVNFPTDHPDQAAGATVYAANCAACHGEDGKGKVEKSRDFTDVDYMRAAAPVAFFQSVSSGHSTMPEFKGGLSDQDRWNVVYYLWSFTVKPDLLAKGKSVFETNCVSCHGPNGQGVIPQAAKFTPEFVSKFPVAQFYQSVSGGKGIMPAWQDRLSTEERYAAIEYARAFAYKPLSQ